MNAGEEVQGLVAVNKNLDELQLYKLQLLQKYLQLTLLVENEMKEGFIQLARARYLTGSRSLFGIQNLLSGDSSLEELNEEDISPTVTVLNNDSHRELQVSSESTGLLRKDKNSYKKVEELFRTALERNIQRVNTMDELRIVSDKIKVGFQEKFNIINLPES